MSGDDLDVAVDERRQCCRLFCALPVTRSSVSPEDRPACRGQHLGDPGHEHRRTEGPLLFGWGVQDDIEHGGTAVDDEVAGPVPVAGAEDGRRSADLSVPVLADVQTAAAGQSPTAGWTDSRVKATLSRPDSLCCEPVAHRPWLSLSLTTWSREGAPVRAAVTGAVLEDAAAWARTLDWPERAVLGGPLRTHPPLLGSRPLSPGATDV